jgi:hypothetical protein
LPRSDAKALWRAANTRRFLDILNPIVAFEKAAITSRLPKAIGPARDVQRKGA